MKSELKRFYQRAAGMLRHAKPTSPSAHKGRTLITLLMMLLTTATAWAWDGTYIGEDGEKHNLEEEGFDAFPIEDTGDGDFELNPNFSWYYVEGNVTINSLSGNAAGGDIHIILCDGATLTITNEDGMAIRLNNCNHLYIYGQSAGTGKLIATSTDYYGINTNGGDLTIAGGIVTATSTEGSGIETGGGNLTIAGGYLKATSTEGSGISVGGGSITLGGGIVTASSYNGTVTIADGWTYTDGTEASYTESITNPADNTTYQPAWKGYGTSESPYMISTTIGLDLLAKRVNSGALYSGTYFQLANDIEYSYAGLGATDSNYTPIGNDPSGHFFSGHFDGGGHKISGIRIYSGDNSQGLFGYNTYDAEVKNVTLADARITGNDNTGGIVGQNGGTVENCHVLSDVTIHADQSYAFYHGGIVGENEGTVTGCTSAAAVTTADGLTGCEDYGGIVGGNYGGTVENCIYLGGAIGGTKSVGAIAGYNGSGRTVSNSYYTSTSITGKDDNGGNLGNADCAVGANYGGTVGTDVGLGYTLTLDEGITCDALTAGSYTVAKEGQEVTLGHNRTGYVFGGYESSDVTITNGTFTMPAKAVTVTATWTDMFGMADGADGSADHPYIISTAAGWDYFCDALEDNTTWNRFSGKIVKLGANIGTAQDPITRMAGSDGHEFMGNFDGGGNTLTFTATAADNYCAPFRNVKGGSDEDHAITISNLNVKTTITATDYRHAAGLIALQSGHVNVSGINATVNISSTVGDSNPHDLYPAALVSQASSSDGGTLTVSGCTASGTISTDGKYAAGLVGIVQGTATITDCVSSVTIDSSTSGDGTHSGCVAVVNGSGTITGCVFNGKLLSKNTGNDATTNCAGFVAWGNGTISNCLYAPATILDGETEVLTGDVNNYPSGTFYRGTAPTVSNCYYTRALGTPQGKAPHTVAAGANTTVAVALSGTATQYAVSGITAYAGGGIKRTEGSADTYYYGQGDALSLTLGNTAAGAPDGYRYDTYTASAGTLAADGTLTMPDDDVTISVSTAHLASTHQAVPVAYVDADGTLHDGDNAAQAVALDGSETSLAAGWYYVGTDITYTNVKIQPQGNINIILGNGKTMHIGTNDNPTGYTGIQMSIYDLTIYGQSTDPDEAGTLSYVGGGKGFFVSNYTQQSGNVSISHTSSYLTKGIDCYKATINGGTFNATGGQWGISTNSTGSSLVEINGGTVNATGTEYGIKAGSGTITLGWTNATDRIYASSYNGTVQVASGKKLHNGTDFLSGTLTDPAADLNGKTLRPAANTTYTTANGTAATADAILLDTGDNSLPAGNYLATGTLNYTHGITLNGNVTLILKDGCTMNVGTSESRINGHGIIRSGTVALTITSQSLGSDMGALSVYTTGSNKYGIFASAITIDGGNVTADTNGSSAYALCAGKTDITINGGTVTANATGGYDGIYANGSVAINGGIVSATGNEAGIYADGTITLGWNKPTDRIYASSYNGTVSVASGQKLTDGTNIYDGNIDYDDHYYTYAIDGKTLYPYIENLDLAANAHDGNYWTTFYCGHTGYKIDDGENAWAYTAEYDDTNSQLTLHKLGKVIPKQTAVIIVGDDNEISMTASTAEAENTVSNDLHGVDVRTSLDDIKTARSITDGTFYVMGKVGSDFGFFEYTGAYMPARKAYLLVSGSAAPGLKMVFDDGETSGLSEMRNEKGEMSSQRHTLTNGQRNAAWYTLSGTRLNAQPTQKGIYIVNGKKVVVK